MAAPKDNKFAEGNSGKPSQYKPEYAAQAEKLCLLGATDDEMAEFFGVHRSTIYRWKLEHEEFCNSIKAAKDIADERVVRSLYQKATGYNYVEQQAFKVKVDRDKEELEIADVERHAPADTTAAIFWLKNRQKDQWRDKQEIEHSGSITEMSDEELNERLARLVNGKSKPRGEA
ncbi:helix-turn-helix domain-containing protein [Escherichia coli]|uniref:helix-turn-helix domain-containing protein n=1 Tax=Enterobacteriaceae TaxID=543 RepID=UPI0019316A8C|nr:MULTISPECIES: helix-turn-helix domain-containing protein [Enterobacteriaceae]MBL7390681.1 helix-turn-helix domain-containing protein [Escherichia coli]UWH33048.1 helix-turn-helix domain-containing protein [Escherichia coli]UWH37712.1 helix-turn-helix domain-containing protein [Escherichia coli]